MAIIYTHCGQTLFRNLKPVIFTCQSCGAEYEIFSDELKNKNHRCASCGARIADVAILNDEKYRDLIEFAKALEVSEVKVVGAERIRIDEKFRSLCEKPRCRNYAKSANCPPHSMMPHDFKVYLSTFAHVLAFKFDLDISAVSGEERYDKLFMLHDATVKIEQHAKTLGFARARGFSGGSCFRSYCREFDECEALKEGGQCRFPDKARPSLSGFGVNWHELSKILGWEMFKDADGNTNPQSTSVMIAGLVLIE